ncbi:protein FAM173B-like [Sinocyclocheilus anshuiensis]|uniref:protein FAM173B-like n=1 Tax=Sinocyclocheilus anshuiensis TaxID=1608454 RepID=UPI0007BA6BCB|nr:PREDICTED: protein FAM173B-like [Sinocyclocheilus anshuiensis]
MEDCIEVILEEHSSRWLSHQQSSPNVTLLIGSAFAGVYGLWSIEKLREAREAEKVWYDILPGAISTKEQTLNVIKLLEGRRGYLADLGSGDGCLVFAAASMGFQCTGFEINSILLACSRSKACWRGIHTDIHFVKQDFWKTDLSKYRNVFLAPAVMGVLEEKLLKELPEDARVIVCRFPFPHWPHSCTAESGLNQVWVYDVHTAREPSRTSPITGLNQPTGHQ